VSIEIHPPIPERRAPTRTFRNFRIVPEIDKSPEVLAFAQTALGKLTHLAMFGLLLWRLERHWIPLLLLLTLVTVFPERRRPLLTLGTIVWACGTWWRWSGESRLLQVGFVLSVAALLFWLVGRYRDSWLGRRPLAVLLTGFAVLVYVASYLPPGVFRNWFWSVLAVGSAYLWFIAYSLLDVNSKNRDSFALQIGTYQPFWGSTNTPFPKGAAYLRRVEARSPCDLAVSQLKALKLLAWSFFLTLLYIAFRRVVYEWLRVPEFSDLFELSARHGFFPWYVGWESLIAEFLSRTFDLTIFGHRIIACCRMAGFLALRNTWRPFESRSIAEFWNRYYFYYKELLVDCFFYPTFVRYFKRYRKLRLFAATFAAAGFGNAFYHFFRDLDYIEREGFWRALVGFEACLFYMFLLALGICISQMRGRRSTATGWLRGRLLPTSCVMLFFCLLRVFDYTNKRYPIWESFRFLFHLFNVARMS
jgi:hypothetical protein